MFDREHIELVEGEIMEMAPQLGLHFTSIRLVEEALRTAFRDGYDVRVQGPLRMGDRSQVQPDVSVVVGCPRDYRDEHPNGALLVVEVADTSLTYDRVKKASLYAKCNIPEYWIVNLIDLRLEVHRRPAELADAEFGHGYLDKGIHFAGSSVFPLSAPDHGVAISDLLP